MRGAGTTKILVARLYDGSTEALFDTNLPEDAEARFIVAGNVIRVCKLRPSGPTAGAVTQNEYGEYDCRGRVALLRISLVSGAPDEKWRPNEVPKGPTPSLPKLAPGNVDALCSGGGGESLVRVWTSGARVARRTGGASSFPTASLPRVASRRKPLMRGVAPQSACPRPSLGSAAYGATTIVLKSLTVVAPPPPRPAAAAATAGDSSSDDSDDDGAPASGAPAKRRPMMVQANLLSPDHGKRTFFVSESPTGVEDFPKVSLRRESEDRLAELAEDAAAFAGAPTAAAARAFTRRASLLRGGLRDVECVGGAAGLGAPSCSACARRVASSPAQTRSRPPPPRPCAICRAPRRRACPRRRSTGVFDDLLRGLRAKRAENASPPSAESTEVLTADGARVATVVDGAHATAAPPAAEPSPAEPLAGRSPR